MSKIMEVQLGADRSVHSGEAISLFSLFAGGGLRTGAEILDDVAAGADIVCKVGGLDELKCKSAISRAKGDSVSVSDFFKVSDLYRQVTAPPGIAKGSLLPVTIETA